MLRLRMLVILLCGLLAGCGDPNIWPAHTSIGTSSAIVMGPNLRLVTERARPMPGRQSLPTMCVDPNPDVVVLFDRTTSAKFNVSATTGLNGEQSVSNQTSETAAAITRDKGVQALRDGLFAACHAYANGAIGQLAYSLILSQYGSLLIALVGGDAKMGPHRSSNDTAIVGLMVACVTEYDPSRVGAATRDGQPAPNPLLTPHFCQNLLTRIASGQALDHKVF